MRVVLLTPEYPPETIAGGIGTNTRTLARELDRQGHTVTVVVPGTESRRTRVDGISVIRVRPQWLPDERAQRILTALRLARVVRAERPDVVHAAEWGALGWAISRLTRLPLVTRLATPTYVVEELNDGGHRGETALLRAMERDQTRRSAAVYAPSHAIASRVGTDWGLDIDRMPMIVNSIDVAAVRAAGAGEPVTELPSRFLVFIGRLERRKGLDVLGPAVAEALASDPDLHAVLVGRDPGDEGGAVLARFQAATAAVSDRVHLLGELERDEALRVVARSELVLLPSSWESFGYVCVEAIALGRPVIATDTGGFAEILTHGVDGWLMPPGDADGLVRETLARLGDPEDTWRVAAAGEKTADRYDSVTVTQQVGDLLAAAAARTDFAPSIYRDDYRTYFHPEERNDPFRRLYQRKRELVGAHFAERPAGLPLLDAGGGYGRLAGPLSRRHDVTMCDLSESMLTEARRRVPGSVSLVQADVRALPFQDGRFEAVLALDVLCHLQDAASGLRELLRAAADGGEVVFDTTNARPCWVLAYPAYVSWRPRRLVRTLLGRGVLPEWQRLVRHHTPDEVRQAAAAVGADLELIGGVGPAGMVKWHVWRATRIGR